MDPSVQSLINSFSVSLQKTSWSIHSCERILSSRSFFSCKVSEMLSILSQKVLTITRVGLSLMIVRDQQTRQQVVIGIESKLLLSKL